MTQSKDPDIDDIKASLLTIPVPGGSKNIIEAGILSNINIDKEKITIELNFNVDRAQQLSLEAQVKTQLSRVGYQPSQIKVKFEVRGEAPPENQPAKSEIPPKRNISNIKHIIAVGSGKGGVGKSTASINLAGTLASRGLNVGLLDADMYGPSIGQMAGLFGHTEVEATENKIIPVEKHGMKIMSFSLLVDRAKAIVWRGPMLGKALEQMIFDVEWGELDYLIIDLPPGTGDVQLSMAQLIDMEGVVIVTTPQSVALHDAERAIDMLKQVKLPLLGIVENMSEFICPNCGESTHIFSSDGGKNLAESFDTTLLGSIPLNSVIMESGEKGIPITAAKETPWPEDQVKAIRDAFINVANNLEQSMGAQKK